MRSLFFGETGTVIAEIKWGATTLARIELDSDGHITERLYSDLEELHD